MNDDRTTWTPERALGEALAECDAITSDCDGGIVLAKLRQYGFKVETTALPAGVRSYEIRVNRTGFDDLDAMQALAYLMQGLDADERRRVLAWANDEDQTFGFEVRS